jgi:hypothetical protein
MIASACVRFFTKADDKMYDIPCHRHADAFYIISQFLPADAIDKTRTEQGFLTEHDTFLDRYAAMKHAIACHQLPEGADSEYAELYSEDLW